MKKIIALLCATLMLSGCFNRQKTNDFVIKDGFYQVMKLVEDAAKVPAMGSHEVLIPFDTLFNPGDFTKVIIDTGDYVPLELGVAPVTEQQTENKKLLSVSFTAPAAAKIKSFTAKRLMKEVVIVLDGKAITMHKIRDTITGDKMEITRCGDNACEYLYAKMKHKSGM
jgi:uncharacterized lipoprotein NlpE involved in copper resistance